MQTLKKAVDLTELAVGIIILGIAVTIGVTILMQVRDNRLTSLDISTVNNETLTKVDEDGDSFTNQWYQATTRCYNSSSSSYITSGNYTTSVNSVDGVGTLKFSSTDAGDTANYNNSNWKCTYTIYNTTRVDWDLPNSAAIGIGEYGNWFNIIVVVGIAGLVLGLIFLAFGRGSSVGSSSGSSGIGGSY